MRDSIFGYCAQCGELGLIKSDNMCCECFDKAMEEMSATGKHRQNLDELYRILAKIVLLGRQAAKEWDEKLEDDDGNEIKGAK